MAGNVLHGKSFVGDKNIFDEHLTDKIQSSLLIGTAEISLTVDSDNEITLDLEKDLHYCKFKYAIVDVIDYGLTAKKFIRQFPAGVTNIVFKVKGAVGKFHEIHRPKQNGLGIELKFTEVGL